MANNSLLLKLSKSKLALILILIVLISSIIASNLLNNYLISEFLPDYYLEAIELDEKPTKFVPYSQIDAYNIQTIFNANIRIETSFVVFLEINELMVKNYRTSNVQYGDSYYRLQFTPVLDDNDRVDFVPLIFLSYVIYTIFLISGVLIVVILIVKIRLYFIKR